MTTIKVYGSHVKLARPLEVHHFDGTLHEWMLINVPGYKQGDHQPITAIVNGKVCDPSEWNKAFGDIDLRPNPQDATTVLSFIGKVIISALVSIALNAIFGKKAKKPGAIAAGTEISFADAKANQPKLNQVIPEIAGRHRVYHDYLNQPRRYFVNESTQAIELMLSVGVGEFTINDARIGETDVNELGAAVDYDVFAPGADVSGRTEHVCWYSAPEVGATTGGSGIRLTAGASGTPSAELTNYLVTGSSIIAPVGSGVFPQDWDVGMTIEITISNRLITIVDGGGTWPTFNRDIVRGDFADLGLSSGDTIKLSGMGANDGRYKINSITSVTTTGTPSSVTGVKVAPLEYLLNPITFTVAGQTVILDDDYADAAELVSVIDAQIGGLTVSEISGAIRITDDSPYDGAIVALAGYYDPVFGASPTHVVGTVTASFDELTLDSWQTLPTGGGEGWDGSYWETWAAATALTPGVYADAGLVKARVESETQYEADGDAYTPKNVLVDYPVAYRITSLVTGTLPNSDTGTIGFEFQRLNPDGTDDESWAGFSPEGLTTNVVMNLQTSNVVGGWVGPFMISPKDEYVNRIEYDVFAPNGIVLFSSSGGAKPLGVGYEVQYRINGGSWSSVTHSRIYATQSQLGWTDHIDIPSTSRNVEIRMRRTGAERQITQVNERLEWYGARTRLVTSPTSYADITSVAMKITGSDVISSQVDNQVNMLVTRKLDGVENRNIVPWVKYVLDSIGVDPANLDDAEFDRLHTLWSSRSDFFDYAQLSQNNVRDVINRALDVGYAEISIDGGLLVPVRDEEKTQHEQSYSAQNFTAPLKRSFSSIRPDEFDGVDVTYLDPETFVETVIECRLPGDLGYKAESIKAEGITDRTRAWRYGIRKLREYKYRRWAYKWSTEMDALNSKYMGYVAVIDDVPGYGKSGWIKSASVIDEQCVMVVSELFELTEGETNVIAWRNADGSLSGPYDVVSIDGFEIVADINDAPDIVQGQEPPHIYFGTTSKWCHDVLITKISPNGMTDISVEGVNYDARIYADDNNSPS